MSGWTGGLQIRGLGRGEVPIADYLCTRCTPHYHLRITGTDRVKHGAADLHLTHQAQAHRKDPTP